MESKRIKKSSPVISYDEKSDVVYISFGKSHPGIASELDEGDFIRIDPYTDEIVGITLLYFSERYTIPPNKDITSLVKNVIPNILNQYHLKSNTRTKGELLRYGKI